MPAQHTSDERQVLVTAIGTTAHDGLIHRCASHLPHRYHVTRAARQGYQGLNGREIEPHLLIVGGIGIRAQATEVGLTALSDQVTPDLLVGREDRGREFQFRAH